LCILNSQFRNASTFDALNSFPYTHLSHPAGALFRTRLRQRNIRKRRYGVRLQSASFDFANCASTVNTCVTRNRNAV
jgi:hypothetical protein